MRLQAPVALIVGVLLLSACAAGERTGALEEPPAQELIPLDTPGAQSNDAVLGVPGAATMLTGLVGEDPRFGQLAAGSGGSLVLSWHGEAPSEELRAVAVEYPEVAVEVVYVDVLPGNLRDIARSLLEEKAAIGVGAAYVTSDFSSIVVLVDDRVQDKGALSDDLTAEVGFPVEVQGGPPMPAS